MRFRPLTSLSIGAVVLLAAVSAQAQLPNLLNRAPARSAWIPAKTLTKARGAVKVTPDQACVYSFTTGSGSTYMNYCITADGTFWNFQSPAGVEMLDPQNIGAYEGYGICDGYTGVSYYDYLFAGNSGNWNAPTTVSSSASSVKIKRVTSDNLWTLTQTITMEAGPPPYAKVVMALKNNSAVTKTLYLLRYAEMTNDVAGGDLAENYDGTIDSAWGNNSYTDSENDGGAPYGMMLQNVGVPTPASTDTFWEGFPQYVEEGPAPCDPFTYYNGTIIYSQGSAVLIYIPGNGLPGKKTVTVTSRYMGF